VPAPANAPRYAIVPNDSTATYRVQETFVGQGIHTAVGSTGAVAGDLYLDLSNPAASTIGTITVDISTLASDSSQRDNQIRQRFLESNKYPTATFVPKRLEGLPDTPYTDGQALAFTIVGDLTIRDVTKEVTWAATGKLDGDTFTGSATTQFNMTDFGFDPPEIAGLLKAENGVALELTIVARRAA
jgi:polyisoprenoid-binding protein YceI